MTHAAAATEIEGMGVPMTILRYAEEWGRDSGFTLVRSWNRRGGSPISLRLANLSFFLDRLDKSEEDPFVLCPRTVCNVV